MPLPIVYSCSGCSSAAQLANHVTVRLWGKGVRKRQHEDCTPDEAAQALAHCRGVATEAGAGPACALQADGS